MKKCRKEKKRRQNMIDRNLLGRIMKRERKETRRERKGN